MLLLLRPPSLLSLLVLLVELPGRSHAFRIRAKTDGATSSVNVTCPKGLSANQTSKLCFLEYASWWEQKTEKREETEVDNSWLSISKAHFGSTAHGSCDVGDHVYCPGQTSYYCAGNSCCQDGSTCPSAVDSHFSGCPKKKAVDCTTASPQEDLSMWPSAGSKAPLLFEPRGGLLLIESQFIAEFAMAFADVHMHQFLAKVLADEELKKNTTFKAMYKQKCEMDSRYEGMTANFAPGFFLLEELAEAYLFTGVAPSFAALEFVAAHGLRLNAKTMGVCAAGLGWEGAAFLTDMVIPMLPVFQLGWVVWEYRDAMKEQTHRAKNFTAHLALKSDCMIQKLKEDVLKESTVSHINGYEGILKQEVQDICTWGMELALENQVQRTTKAKIEVFETLVNLGKCLYPHGTRAWAKRNCVSALYFRLLQHDGKSGILYEALSFMAYYGFGVDELLKEPFYGKWYKEEFGIATNATGVSLLPMLQNVKNKSLAERWPVCVSVMATHRAFERTFLRIKAAISIWMQTFARDTRFESPTGSWYPCQKVFNKVGVANATSNQEAPGMCKHYDFKEGHDKGEHDIDEKHACTRAAGYKGSLWPETEDNNEYRDLKEEKSEWW